MHLLRQESVKRSPDQFTRYMSFNDRDPDGDTIRVRAGDYPTPVTPSPLPPPPPFLYSKLCSWATARTTAERAEAVCCTCSHVLRCAGLLT